MRIFAIDDEPAMLEELLEVLKEVEPDAEILGFGRAKPAFDAFVKTGAPDVVFTDVELPGVDGLTLVSRVKEAAPHAKIVFVTAHPHYAVEAYRRHVDGFIVKPVEAARVREELDVLFGRHGQSRPRLTARCFGSFEVFVNGDPVIFSRARAKELLAYLVDRNGGTSTGSQIAQALWEDRPPKDMQPYLRVLTKDLRDSLEAAGVKDVLVREHNQWAVRPQAIDCDYYRLLAGDAIARAAFTGEYMTQYSWAEPTAADLYFRFVKLIR